MFRRIVEIEGAPSLNYLGMKMSPDRAEVMSERAGALSYIVCIVLLQLTLANAFDWPERIVVASRIIASMS